MLEAVSHILDDIPRLRAIGRRRWSVNADNGARSRGVATSPEAPQRSRPNPCSDGICFTDNVQDKGILLLGNVQYMVGWWILRHLQVDIIHKIHPNP